jgi:putative addiction module component (TIGR02574 family)
MSTLLEQALKLPVAERIRLADDLYDSVGGSPGSVRLTDQQLDELVRRIEDYQRDPGGNLSWEEVRDAALTR